MYKRQIQERYDEAEPLILEALETARRIFVEDDPRVIDSMHEVARFLLSGRDPAKPAEALPLAREVNELTGYGNPDYLETLALALFLTGDARQAAEVQSQAIALLPAGDSPRRAELEATLARYEAALSTGDG